MSVRVTSVNVCDRCKQDYNPRKNYNTRTIGHLAFMIKRGNSGSKLSDMSLDLCEECTTLFLTFMNNGKGE